MSTATQRSSRAFRPGVPDADRPSGAPGRRIAAVVAVLLVALLGAWAAGWFGSRVDPRVDPRVEEILALQRQAREEFAANGGPRTEGEAAAVVAAMGQIREKVESLPAGLRAQVERSGNDVDRSAMRARMDAYFALPPEQRAAELDRQIDQEELMHKAKEATAVTSALRGPGGDAQNAGGQQAGSGTAGQAGGPPPGPGVPGGPGGPGSRTEEERNRWRKAHIIDRTSPEQRAEYTEYRRAMDARREKRVLPATRPR